MTEEKEKKLVVLASAELIRRLDLWWRKRPEIANRSDALRVLIIQAVEADEREAKGGGR